VYFSEVFHEKRGFDIIIANPPYGNLLSNAEKAVISKKYKSYASEIAAIFVEKYLSLLKKDGTITNIITSAIAYHTSLSYSRYLLQNNFSNTTLFTFDRDPVGLFDSMSQSVCVFISSNYQPNCKGNFYTSASLRTTLEVKQDLERVVYSLPACLANSYLLGNSIGVDFTTQHRLPKIGDGIVTSIINKLIQQPKQIRDVMCEDKRNQLIIRTSGNYWYNAFDRKPYKSTEIKTLFIINETYRNFLLVLVNSSLFYLWGRVYSDGRHMPVGLLKLFHLPDEKTLSMYSGEIGKLSQKIMTDLFSVFNAKSNQFQTRLIKSSINDLDIMLAKIYGLSEEELAYIINYDGCIRNKDIRNR